MRRTSRERRTGTTSDQELTAALAALDSFQAVTQQSDAKANMLLAIHLGLGVALSSLTGPGQRHGLTLVIAVAYLAGFVANSYEITQAMRPRPARVATPNPFALDDRARRVPAARPADRAQQAWEIAGVVADIAQVKNRHVSRAIGWTSYLVALAGCAVILSDFR